MTAPRLAGGAISRLGWRWSSKLVRQTERSRARSSRRTGAVRQTRPPRAGAEAGFTLLELLVAMSLLAVLLALMFGGLRFGTRVWESGDAALRGLSDLQSASNFVRRQIASSIPRNASTQAGDGEPTPSFRGAPDGLKLVTLAPSQLMPGGLYEVALGLDGGGGGGYRLSAWLRPLARQPGDERLTIDQDERTRQVVLLDGVADLRLRYFGQGEDFDEPPTWHDRWEDMLAPPNLVSVRVTFAPGDRRTWPELVVAPRAAAGYQ